MKDIKGYEGKYAVTSCGKVWSYKSRKFLKPEKDKDGYLQVFLLKNGKGKQYKIHRLVAIAYIKNQDNKPEVNHKDENKTNNCLQNLEWLTKTENLNYGTHNKRMSDTLCKAVICVETGNKFRSALEAAEQVGASRSAINKCCLGKSKSSGGYHWKFA